MMMVRVLILISALALAAWTHGGGQVPGSIVIDDLSSFVIDDIGNQVVAT